MLVDLFQPILGWQVDKSALFLYVLLFRDLCHSCHFILGTKFSWIWSQKVTGDLSWYIIISWGESPTIPRNVVRQFLSPLLKSRMQCVSVLLSLQLSANLQDFVVIPAIICRCNVVSVYYSYNLICICYKSIWAMWSSLYESVWWNGAFFFFVKHSEVTWFAQFLRVLWSLMSG